MAKCSEAFSGIDEFKVSILLLRACEPRNYGRSVLKTQAENSLLDCADEPAYLRLHTAHDTQGETFASTL